MTDLDGWYEVENAEKVNHSFIKDGLKIKNHTQLSISDAIALFFTSNFFNIAFKYTNQNIIRKNETRKQKIKPVTFDEIKKYIAIYLYLGIAPVKNVKYLWNTKCKWTYNPNIAVLMTNHRFRELNVVFDLFSVDDYIDSRIKNEPKIVRYLNKKSYEIDQ